MDDALATEKIKVLVLGDSGVGKTSLTHLICHSEPLSTAPWTIGASIDVRIHEYHEGTPNQKPHSIELWDIGGSRGHFIARQILYHSIHGIILVHDMTNSKSHANLRKWLNEVICDRDLVREPPSAASPLISLSALLGAPASFDDTHFDPEAFAGKNIPVLVVGTKVDLMAPSPNRNSFIAQECHAEEILVDTTSCKSLSAGSTNTVKLDRFFDKVVDRKYALGYRMPFITSSFSSSSSPFDNSSSSSTRRHETSLFMSVSHMD